MSTVRKTRIAQPVLILFQAFLVSSFTPSFEYLSIRPLDGFHYHLKKNGNAPLMGLTDGKNGSDQKKLFVDKEDEKEGLPIDTIFGRTLDTVEDAIRLATRLPVEKGWIERPPVPDEEMCPSVVVLGSGWAAHALLKIVDTTKTRLTVISPSNHFVFTPSTY